MMEVPAAGAEVPLVNAKAAVVLVGEEEVGRRAQGSAAGCCRCSRCEAVLATLLVLAALAALALGYVLYAHVHTHTPPTPQVYAANSTTCHRLQWRSDLTEYQVFNVTKDGKYHVDAWIAFSPGSEGKPVLHMKEGHQERKLGKDTIVNNVMFSTGNAYMTKEHRVVLHLEDHFTNALFCVHELPA